MSTSRRVILKYVGWGAIASPFVGLGTVVGLGPSVLERQRVAARREGIPLLPEDLHRIPVADADNAALPLRALTQYWVDTSRQKGQNWDSAASKVIKHPEDKAAQIAFIQKLEQHPEVLKLAEEAARRPHCDFQYDWSLGFDLLFFEFATVRRVGGLFAARARLASTPEKAFQDVVYIASLAQLLWETPVTAALRVGVALQSMASTTYIDTLRRFGSSLLAHKTLAEFALSPQLEFFCRGDVVSTLITMKQLREGKFRSDTDSSASVDVWRSASELFLFTGDYWEQRLLLYWRDFYAILRSTENANEREKRVQACRERLLEGGYVQQYLNLVASLIGPFGEILVGSLRTLEVHQAFRETALSLVETRATPGRFPNKPTLPKDPYADNKTLGYRREGDGCILWSVGPNREDDGGVERSSDKSILDLVVRL